MSNTVVRTNVMSLNSHRNLGMVANQQSRASARLSSGFRINSAADDAAGLGISEKMRAQIRGLDQASRNAADGISLIQTAEGALGTVNEILIRIRELVIQASNDTNVGGTGMQSDRLRIQDEIDQLMQEIDSISTRTEFNTRTLLDGSLSQAGVIRGGEWETVDQVRINAPAQIQTLDQFLRMTSNEMFTGSFSDLLVTIGANLQGRTAEDWIAVNAGAQLDGLEKALDLAMGVNSAQAGTVQANGQGRWAELPRSAGLNFRSARELLDAFVQGLHNPNAMRPPSEVKPGQSQVAFASWSAFIGKAPTLTPAQVAAGVTRDVGANTAALSAGTFARAVSNAGGETIYQALIRTGAFGLNSSPSDPTQRSTFSDVRQLFNNMGGLQALQSNSTNWGPDSTNGLGIGCGPTTASGGWATPKPPTTGNSYTGTALEHLVEMLNSTAGGKPSWMQTRLGLFGRVAADMIPANFYANDPTTFDSKKFEVKDGELWHKNEFGITSARGAHQYLVGRYLTANSEIVKRDVWVPNQSERENGKALWFQIGANSRQGINVEIGSMSTGTLFGREGANHSADRRIVNVLDVAGYNVQAGDDSNYGHTIGGNRVRTLIEAIDGALSTATRQRSELGAVQNRLEFTIENLDIASENLSAANSRIRDADMAKEMMRLTQANVLQQAAISMLAQANQAPQNVLQLLN